MTGDQIGGIIILGAYGTLLLVVIAKWLLATIHPQPTWLHARRRHILERYAKGQTDAATGGPPDPFQPSDPAHPLRIAYEAGYYHAARPQGARP